MADDKGIRNWIFDTGYWQIGDGDVFDSRERRSFGLQSLGKSIEDSRMTDGFDLYTSGTIEHPAEKTQVGSQVIDERAKSHPLHNARDVDTAGGNS